MSKKWVFNSLVEDDKDAIGLVAYALYKHKKHTLATNLRSQGKEEGSIQQQVDTFHDQTLQNNSLDDYREKATNYLNSLFLEIENEEREKFARERAKIEKQHQSSFKKEKAKILKNMREYQSSHKSWFEKLGNWLISGIPGIVSSFLVTSLILGASMLLVNESKRQEVFAELAVEYLGISAQVNDSTGNKKLR
ncbi:MULTISPECIES: hypothetical protein [unclassified Marinobacter]|uniref:hypothetical protein n=1 Tax=unclassified Marinobacter TaxID=83889 RepID=UPI000C008502|nr:MULTISPECIES: hypothetical protein [unclassified Marinobacter]PFG10017.1 hypothetical protein ATI45_2427 [Marinobacter sp. LV10MA510-1]PFG51942.1 hypothetical protein ATG98_0921 [Marinobacter sp. LV10R520-4]